MPSSPMARKCARELCLQSLYQWQISGNSISQITKEMLVDVNADKIDDIYFKEALEGISQQTTQLDEHFLPFIDIPYEQLDPISLAILRIGSFEMSQRIDIPYKVVINEGVNLAKKFGPTDSKKFVNGVLDKLAKEHRTIELNSENRT